MSDLIFITETEAKRLEALGLKPVAVWAIKKRDIDFISGLGGKKKRKVVKAKQVMAEKKSQQAKAIEFEIIQPNIHKGRQGDTQTGKCVERLLTGRKKGDVISRSAFKDFPPWMPQALVESEYLKVLKRVGE